MQLSEGGGLLVSFEHWYVHTLATNYSRQKGEGPQSVSSINDFWSLDSIATKALG